MLEPFIDAGFIHLVPNPMEFNDHFRRETMAMVEERAADWTATSEDMMLGMALAEDDAERSLVRLSDEKLTRMFRQTDPDLGTEGLEVLLQSTRERRDQDPFALLQPPPVEDGSAELQLYRGINLELALFFAHLTGSAIYSDELAYWKQLHEHTSAATDCAPPSVWTPLAQKLSELTLTIDADPQINLEIRLAGKLASMRRSFRRIWNAVLTCSDDASATDVADRLVRDLVSAWDTSITEWERCSMTTASSMRFPQRIWFSSPQAGFGMNTVHRMLVTSGRNDYINFVPLALFLGFGRFPHNGSPDQWSHMSPAKPARY